MPNELTDAPYNLVKRPKHDNPLKRSPKLPESHGESVDPKFLLQHENHFDKNVVMPDQYSAKPGVFAGRNEDVSKT